MSLYIYSNYVRLLHMVRFNAEDVPVIDLMLLCHFPSQAQHCSPQLHSHSMISTSTHTMLNISLSRIYNIFSSTQGCYLLLLVLGGYVLFFAHWESITFKVIIKRRYYPFSTGKKFINRKIIAIYGLTNMPVVDELLL